VGGVALIWRNSEGNPRLHSDSQEWCHGCAHSLKLAFEQLLGGPCYHMLEVTNRPDQAAFWAGAAGGNEPDWNESLGGYVATVDWPAASVWRELGDAAPEAMSTSARWVRYWRALPICDGGHGEIATGPRVKFLTAQRISCWTGQADAKES